MAKSQQKGATRPGEKIVATNREARRDYEILDTVECGIVLKGAEVKSLREAKVRLTDSYARLRDGEVWLVGLHVNPYSRASNHEVLDPDRDRKLLLRRDEIERLRPRLEQEHLALVPLRLYFREGRAKVELALGRGRTRYDKRQALAKREADREAARAMAHRGRT